MIQRKMKIPILILLIVSVAFVPILADAHQSGCHRWHSCPSDSGSYVCGDLGYDTYCPKSSPTTELPKYDPPKEPVKVEPKPTLQVQSKIPSWIKNNAGWWADGSIDDTTFVSGMKFLINEGTLKIPQTTPGTGTGSNQIPTWIKNNAGWWADGSIDDNSFVQGIQFLIKEGILKVSNDEKSINSSNNYKSLISVSTKSKYVEGETIVISGKVSTIIVGTPVTLQIFNQGNLVDIVQFKVSEDGSYSYTIIAEGPHWSKPGEYTVRVSYGEGNVAETQFSFSSQIVMSVTNAFEVNAGSYGTFDVKYGITGGSLKNITTDFGNYALVVTIMSTDNGSLLLEIPRESFDAKKYDKTDDTFIVIIDGIEVPYQETVTNTNSRIIKINFENGDSIIKIIGNMLRAN